MQEKVVWTPFAGPQTLLLSCTVHDIFYGGARGGGKTAGIIAHFAKHAGKHPKTAHGIIVRKEYKPLEEVMNLGKKILSPIGFIWLDSKDKYMFVHPSGAKLKLRHLKKLADADNYQGHSYNWMAFEELTQWADSSVIDRMNGALRDPDKNMECYSLASANPGGIGHNWVKDRYINPAPPFTPFMDNGIERIFIPSRIQDNEVLRNDKNYKERIKNAGPAWLVQAWLEGDWNIVAGGFLSEIWNSEHHVCDPFEIPLYWRRWRAMDWGSAKPYSIGWYAMSEENIIYRYRELYGWGGKADKGTREDATTVARKILAIEKPEREMGIDFSFTKCPADTSIGADFGLGTTIKALFKKEGVYWNNSQKNRISGASIVINALRNNKVKVFSTCKHFLRTVPVLAINENNPEDVDTNGEDHCYDEFRYSLCSRQNAILKPEDQAEYNPFAFKHLVKMVRYETNRKTKYGFN